MSFFIREKRGAEKANRVRWGDVWKVKEGVPLRAKELFRGRRGWKRELTAQVAAQGEARQAAGACFLLPDWQKRAVKTLPVENFCLTPEGVELAFPQCAIAPAAEGIPAFTVPYRSTETPLSLPPENSKRPLP